jgi:hypothetical protein
MLTMHQNKICSWKRCGGQAMKPDTQKTFLMCFLIVFVPLMFALLVSPGCGEGNPATPEQGPVPKAIQVGIVGSENSIPDRFSATSYGRFLGGPRYDRREREIFIIKDKETGIEYLTITGCGTTELVLQGKTLQEE